MKHISTIIVLAVLLTFSSSFGQVSWTKYPENPVILPGESDSWDEFLFPFSILFHDDVYHLWYGGFDGSTARIGYAFSNDGIIWTRSEDPVLNIGEEGSWDDERVLYPYVLYDGIAFRMWYGGWNGSNVRIGYATSPDGITWTKYVGNPVMDIGPTGSWDNAGVFDPCVYFDGATFYMLYGGSNGFNIRIGYATSADGITWAKFSGNPILNGDAGSWDERHVRAPELFFDGNSYHMWYSGTTAFDADREYQIGYATSPDVITWTKYAENPILVPSESDWDSQWVGFSRVLWDSVGKQYNMWYGGGNDDVNTYGGFATSPDTFTGIHDVKVTNLPIKYVLMQNHPNPFNPVTMINYQLPMTSAVELSIYNLLGQRVATLVNEQKRAGHHQAEWDASGFSSGIYYYCLQAGEFVEIKKLVLLK